MSARRKPQICEPADLSVYDGARLFGFIRERSTGRTASTADGRSLGSFPTRKAACDAIGAAVLDQERAHGTTAL
jgi:hypothetical protein